MPIQGGCHCGAVSFEVDAEPPTTIYSCNCSICEKTGFLHWIVSDSEFRILSGQDALTEYRFNTGTARHLFCSLCGVKAFYVPRSHPEGWSVNARCLHGTDLSKVAVEAFDGQNWDESINRLKA